VNAPTRVPFDDLVIDDEQVASWQDRPFTGVAFDTFADGRPRSEASYVDGVQQGVAREWHPNGALKAETSYWNGSGHGLERAWNEEGRLLSETLAELGIGIRERQWDAGGALTRDWRIGPDDNLWSTLQIFRRKFADAPPLPAID
jgi:antitoxin component YwqK of YwqJK toxin-antitoxin module